MLVLIVPENRPEFDRGARWMKQLPRSVKRLLDAMPARTAPRARLADVGAAFDIASGPGAENALALIGWLCGRRDISVHSLSELRRRWDEVAELFDCDRAGMGPWHRRRQWGWCR